MRLIDTSPGGFFSLANVAFYLFVAVEVAMILTGSMVAVALVLALMVLVSILLMRWMHELLGPDEPETVRPPARRVVELEPGPALAPAPAPRPPAPRLPAHVA